VSVPATDLNAAASRHHEPDARISLRSYLLVFSAFAAILLVLHAPYLSLPYFWDELGQFVPSGLDILRHGWWVPHSATPNVHPPAVMAWLALSWKVAGYSVIATRVAMLLIGALAVYAAFLLAIQMCRGLPGAPAFFAVLLLLATPLFYTQAMMAQLDMPAMALTTIALLLFFQRRYAWCGAACTLLVLVKETGVVAPALLAAWLIIAEKRWREPLFFAPAFVALAAWLVFLKQQTGYWLGDPGFAQYNVEYTLNGVRVVMAFARRLYYLFVVDFRWIGTLAIIYALRNTRIFRTRAWAAAAIFVAMHVILVSLFGGAELERYLLPVLPVLYVAMAAGFEAVPRLWRIPARIGLTAGLIAGLFWNPPYPFPYENNLAMVDFVELHHAAADYLDRAAGSKTVATAWPLSIALRRPENGYVTRRLHAVETQDFHVRNVISTIKRSNADVLVTYSRTWEPPWGVLESPMVEQFLRRFYEYEPQISGEQIERQLGFHLAFESRERGQWIAVYEK
jgi:4-amino-4-deoxy-L-arabinose transferase-like glycosyltransferase